MMWVDYSIDQVGESFRIVGEWPGEVMGWTQSGEKSGGKDNILYKPGDVFIVNEHGWLMKTDEVNNLLRKHENSKKSKS